MAQVENPCSFETLKFQSDQFICMSDLERTVLFTYLLAAAIKAIDGPDLTELSALESAIAEFKKESKSTLDSMDVATAVDIALIAGVDPSLLTRDALTPVIRTWLCADQNNWRAARTVLLCLLTNTQSQVPCWVAQEVYGINNPRWLAFRRWLISDSPGWLRALYIGYGKSFSRWISDKPKIKIVVRYLMDKVVNGSRD